MKRAIFFYAVVDGNTNVFFLLIFFTKPPPQNLLKIQYSISLFMNKGYLIVIIVVIPETPKIYIH